MVFWYLIGQYWFYLGRTFCSLIFVSIYMAFEFNVTVDYISSRESCVSSATGKKISKITLMWLIWSFSSAFDFFPPSLGREKIMIFFIRFLVGCIIQLLIWVEFCRSQVGWVCNRVIIACNLPHLWKVQLDCSENQFIAAMCSDRCGWFSF